MGRLVLGALSLWVLYLEAGFVAAINGELFDSVLFVLISTLLIIPVTATLIYERLLTSPSQ